MIKSFWHRISIIGLYLFLFGASIATGQIDFNALPDCDDNTGTQAALNSMYVHISSIAGTDGINDITFSAQTAAAGLLTTIEVGTGISAADTEGTLLIEDLSESDWGTTILLTINNNGTTANIELPIPICGFNVDSSGGGTIEDDVSNGVFCTTQNGKSAPGILAQVLPDASLISHNDITSGYVYVLVDNTDANAIEAYNQTGVFDSTDGVENNHQYTMYAFYVSSMEQMLFYDALDNLSAISTGDDILTLGGAFAGLCYNYCCENSFTPNCCSAEAGDITTGPLEACLGSSELSFVINLGADNMGNVPPISTEYDYAYLVVEGGNIAQVHTNNAFDFSSYTGTLPVTYTIYGLSYKTDDINNFTGVSGGSISELEGTPLSTLLSDISTAPLSTQVCAELTDDDFTVTIYDEPSANPLPATTCLGGLVDIDGQATGANPLAHNWTIVTGSNTTATGVSLSNQTTGTVQILSDINGTVGTVELEYTVSDANTCSSTHTVLVTIAPCDVGTGEDVMLDDPCVCLNNATNEENGQFVEVVSIYSFAANQDWYIQSLSSYNTSTTLSNAGLFDINSPAPPADPTPLATGVSGVYFTDASNDGIDNDMQNGIDDAGEEGLYYLNAIHYDGLGFVLTVANDALGITRTITNRGCYYPNPNISVPSVLCSSALPLDLTTAGNAVNGSDNTTMANIDANGDPFYTNGVAFFNDVIAGNYPAGGVFDLYDSNGNLIISDISSIPDNLPTSGMYNLTYTFNQEDTVPNPQPSGANIDIGPFDRGCVQTTSINIQINLVDCNYFPWDGRN